MSAVVFVGPTLSTQEVCALLPQALIRGPARCGDVYEASTAGPRVIVLIDGYFDHSLSVWHKEILWALSNGIDVYGGASMGALRAAELHSFGMVGVGRIYEQYVSGELENDDEVAVLHESAERDYAIHSEALVNLRATLGAAVAAGIIDCQAEATLIAAAKRLFYAERSFASMLENAEDLEAEQKSAFSAWLQRHGSIDQKRRDALALLEWVQLDNARSRATKQPNFAFARTNYWTAFQSRRDGEIEASRSAAQGGSRHQGVLRAVRRLPAERRAVVERLALERAFALLLAQSTRAQVSVQQIQAASERVRKELNLLTPAATSAWLEHHGLSLTAFSALAQEEALIEQLASEVRERTAEQLARVLMTLGY